MCKANSHAEDSNAKTLPNSCLEAARFAPENCRIHAEKSQYPCSKATIFMLEQHENHFQAPQKSCSKAAEFTQKTNPNVVDPHGITRRRRFAPANSQRAARSRGGFRRHQTSPAPRHKPSSPAVKPRLCGTEPHRRCWAIPPIAELQRRITKPNHRQAGRIASYWTASLR